MPTSSAVRLQIESALARRIPSALTPAARMVRPVAATGIGALDEVLQGGLPIGAVTEIVGPACSGRSSLALGFVARMTQSGKVCAWIDASDRFDPLGAASAGLDLARLLWVRCGARGGSRDAGSVQTSGVVRPTVCAVSHPANKGVHGGGCGMHPRNETRGLSEAVGGFLEPGALAPRCAEPQRRAEREGERVQPVSFVGSAEEGVRKFRPGPDTPWLRIEQALRSADLLLQGGGFGAIVLDFGDLEPEFVSRVPLATWHRYRLASERTQSSIVLVTQHACAKSSAELLLRMEPATSIDEGATVFSGLAPRVEVARRRFGDVPDSFAEKVVSIRKPPRNATSVQWQSRTAWTGAR